MEPEGSLSCSQEPATGSYPGHMNSVYTLTPYFLKIHFSIIFLFMLRSSTWSLPVRFSDQHFIPIFHLPRAVPSHPSRFDDTDNIWWRGQIMKFKFLTAVKMSMLVFWVVTPFELVGRYQRFRGPEDGAVCSSETLISAYKFTRRYNPEDQHRHKLWSFSLCNFFSSFTLSLSGPFSSIS
jgi:hypothetical protein